MGGCHKTDGVGKGKRASAIPSFAPVCSALTPLNRALSQLPHQAKKLPLPRGPAHTRDLLSFPSFHILHFSSIYNSRTTQSSFLLSISATCSRYSGKKLIAVEVNWLSLLSWFSGIRILA